MNRVASLETHIWVYFFIYNLYTLNFSRYALARVSCVHIGSWRSSIKYLRPWLLSQKLSIGRFITSSN